MSREPKKHRSHWENYEESHDSAFVTAFENTKRGIARHRKKLIITTAGLALSGLLYGIGEWAGPKIGEWWTTHHLISDADLVQFRKDHWAIVSLERDVSNLQGQINPPDSVGRSNSTNWLTVATGSATVKP